jgi:hypothetical protein
MFLSHRSVPRYVVSQRRSGHGGAQVPAGTRHGAFKPDCARERGSADTAASRALRHRAHACFAWPTLGVGTAHAVPVTAGSGGDQYSRSGQRGSASAGWDPAAGDQRRGGCDEHGNR